MAEGPRQGPENPGKKAGQPFPTLRSQAPISVLLLTAGREEFLAECVESIRGQTEPPSRLVVVNDGPALSSEMTHRIQEASEKTAILQTRRPRSGQWKAFRTGLENLTEPHPFCIVHDDDRLKPDYVRTLAEFSARQSGAWICTRNLEVFPTLSGQPLLILPEETKPFVLQGTGELSLRYSKNFLPFPGTCFALSPQEVGKHIHEEYQEMADAVLLCECAAKAKIFFEPRPIYEYRRHAGQVSENMGHAMEDRLQDYLLGAARGAPVETQVKRNLEKRRAERFFYWAWESGTFRGYPYRKQFRSSRVFRCIRNRKIKTLKIICQDFWKNFQEIVIRKKQN
jgi:glycosyltransferase involved in cell wall biosynthesis